MPWQILDIIAPVFAVAGLGFVWAKAGRAFDNETVTSLVTLIGAPCLVYGTLAKLQVGPAEFALMAGATVLALAVCAAVAAPLLRLAGLPLNAFLPAMMFPNGGNMGLSLSLFAFGDAGLALAISCFSVYALAQFTVGAAISSGVASWGRVVRTPMLYAVALGVVGMIRPFQLPAWLGNTIDLIAGLTIPLMLFALGVSLARLRVADTGLGLGLAVLRLGLGLGVGVGLAALLGLEGTARGVLIIETAMPVAVFNYLFAARYGRRPEQVAGAVVLSTAISFATLPGLMWLVL